MDSLARVKKHNYFLHTYKVTSAASICMHHPVVTDQHIFAHNTCTHLVFKELILITANTCTQGAIQRKDELLEACVDSD